MVNCRYSQLMPVACQNHLFVLHQAVATADTLFSPAVFFILYHVASAPSPAEATLVTDSVGHNHRHLLVVHKHEAHLVSGTTHATLADTGSTQRLLQSREHNEQVVTHINASNSNSQGRHMLNASSYTKTGNARLTASARAVRIAFYLWLSLVNLLATSTLWARAADAFDSNAAARLFGFLGAGATLGEPCCYKQPVECNICFAYRHGECFCT